MLATTIGDNQCRLWHVTTVTNWNAIQRTGAILPKIGPRSSAAREHKPAIYFFNTVDALHDAAMSWMEHVFEEEDELIVLEVIVPKHWTQTTSMFECETTVSEAVLIANIVDLHLI